MYNSKITLEYITDYIDKKIYKNNNYISVTFYELRIKENLTEEETNIFIHFSTLRLKNLGYKIYFTGENYLQDDKQKIVKSNILFIAIK